MEVQTAEPVQLVIKMRTALAANNYVSFFATVRTAPYLLACLAHSYFRAIRASAFAAICTGASPGNTSPCLGFLYSSR